MRKLSSAVALFLGINVTSAFAGVPAIDAGNIYIEGSFGNVEYGVPDEFFNFDDGFDHASGYRVIGGLGFKRSDKNSVSFEGLYLKFNEAKLEESYTDASAVYTGTAKLSMDGLGLGLRLARNWEDFFLYTRIGLYRWDLEANLAIETDVIDSDDGDSILEVSASEDGVDPYIGAGVHWFLTDNFFLGAEWTYYPADLEGDDIRVNVGSITGGINF